MIIKENSLKLLIIIRLKILFKYIKLSLVIIYINLTLILFYIYNVII